eukprot:GHVR01143852.1.p2 GENE.GHVR01143852.1~~GHVR01143852.1.p2  ORF type:complete len:133 (+),score=7.23 GHVR01143852.1:231-629(+)
MPCGVPVSLTIDAVQTDHHRANARSRRPHRHQNRDSTRPAELASAGRHQRNDLIVQNIIDIIRQKATHVLQLGNYNDRVRNQAEDRDQRRNRRKQRQHRIKRHPRSDQRYVFIGDINQRCLQRVPVQLEDAH